MMNHRFNLFYAGYTAYVPTLYYNQLSLVDTYQKEEDEQIKTCISKFSTSLKHFEDEYNSYLKSAMGIAEHFELKTLPQPSSHTDYFNWLRNFIETFENQFPMSRIDHYYFLYSRKIAEIVCNMGLIKAYLDLSLELDNRLDLKPRIGKAFKDTEYIIFKMIASAALLSSEPRHNYFNVFYRTINKEFEPFKELKIEEMGSAQIQTLAGDVDKYQCKVKDGFKECIGLLKELQV